MDLLSSNIKKILLCDTILFLILTVIVNSYKLFFLLLSFILTTFLTYLSVNYFIELCFLSERSHFNESNANGDFKFKLFRLLFHNEHIYKLMRILLRKNFFNNQLQKFISTSARQTNQKHFYSSNTSSKLDLEVRIFIKKFSHKFIESWYKSHVSDNDQFLSEAQIQLEIIFLDIFSRVKHVDRLKLFAKVTHLFSKNFLNIALALKSGQIKQIPLENLHPAARNAASSEITYYKRIIQIILRKSSPNLNLNNPLIEELFLQIIGRNCLENLVAILIRPKFIYFSMALIVDTPRAYEKFYPIEKNISITESLLIEENITDGDYISITSSIELLNDLNDEHGDDEHGESLQTDVDFSNQVENAMPRTSSNISNKNLNGSDFEIFNLRIDKTEITMGNSGKTKYTLYNIEVFKFI